MVTNKSVGVIKWKKNDSRKTSMKLKKSLKKKFDRKRITLVEDSQPDIKSVPILDSSAGKSRQLEEMYREMLIDSINAKKFNFKKSKMKVFSAESDFVLYISQSHQRGYYNQTKYYGDDTLSDNSLLKIVVNGYTSLGHHAKSSETIHLGPSSVSCFFLIGRERIYMNSCSSNLTTTFMNVILIEDKLYHVSDALIQDMIENGHIKVID